MGRQGRAVREVVTRIVYWGPRGSGKTSSLRALAEKLEAWSRSPLLAPSDEDDRTLFMDFLTVEMGALDGVPVRLHLVGLPGDSRLNENALALIRGADGFVFVADSAPDRQAQNRSALDSLCRHLVAIGEPDRPVVLQLNRRDASGAVAVDEMVAELGGDPQARPWFESIAVNGTGVVEPLTAAAARVVAHLSAAAEGRSTS